MSKFQTHLKVSYGDGRQKALFLPIAQQTHHIKQALTLQMDGLLVVSHIVHLHSHLSKPTLCSNLNPLYKIIPHKPIFLSSFSEKMATMLKYFLKESTQSLHQSIFCLPYFSKILRNFTLLRPTYNRLLFL